MNEYLDPNFQAELRKVRFANRLKNERMRLKKSVKLSLADIAKKCGVSQRKWKSFEDAEEMPDIVVLLNFANLGADMEYLFTASQRLNDDERNIIEVYRTATLQSQFALLSLLEVIERKTEQELKQDKEWRFKILCDFNLNP